MQLLDQIKKILDKRDHDNLPINISDWANELSLPEYYFKRCKEIEEATKSKAGWFVKEIKNGSTGWEYTFTIYYAFGDFFYTKYVGGDYESVMPIIDSPKDFKAIPDYKNNKVTASFKLANRNKGKEEWHKHEIKDIPIEKFQADNKKYDNRFIPVITTHSHPNILIDGQSVGHTFFSQPDLSFLLKSSVLMLVMVSKNHIWFMCKTSGLNKSYEEVVLGLRECTLAEQSGIDAIKECIRKNFTNSGLVFYHATYKAFARRVN